MTMPVAVRHLDEALARAARLEVEARQWRIKSGLWRQKYEQQLEEIADLKAQLRLTLETGDELIRLADSLRAERDAR